MADVGYTLVLLGGFAALVATLRGVGTAVIANVVGGVVALALLVYLVVALVRPERF